MRCASLGTSTSAVPRHPDSFRYSTRSAQFVTGCRSKLRTMGNSPSCSASHRSSGERLRRRLQHDPRQQVRQCRLLAATWPTEHAHRAGWRRSRSAQGARCGVDPHTIHRIEVDARQVRRMDASTGMRGQDDRDAGVASRKSSRRPVETSHVADLVDHRHRDVRRRWEASTIARRDDRVGPVGARLA